jgi:murein DD-endopeptidase MepM/ murein hydrolase activator NlpD
MKDGTKEKYESRKQAAAAFLKRNGFTLVLLMCLVVIGVAAFVTFLPMPEEDAPVRQSGDERLGVSAPEPTVRIAVLDLPGETPEEEESTIQKPTPAPTPEAKTVQAASAPAKAAAPLKGAIVCDYAMDELIYSRTLEQWTTHAGVDIAAAPGAEVHAVLGGEVSEVYEDDALGVTVVITHSGDRRSLYANLSKNPPVKEGQRVNAADVIGTVGDTAISECMEESHLHFGFFVHENCTDPKEIVLFAS